MLIDEGADSFTNQTLLFSIGGIYCGTLVEIIFQNLISKKYSL